jgi:hypothetical protein
MPKVTLLTPSAILLDGKPAGTPGEFLAAYPHLAPEFSAALQAHYEAIAAEERIKAEERVRLAERAAAELKARYEPASLDVYFLVVELPPGLRTADADHFGLRAVERGGQWRGDLLRAVADQAFALFQANGLAIPVGERVSSLSELTAAHLAADLEALSPTPAEDPAPAPAEAP